MTISAGKHRAGMQPQQLWHPEGQTGIGNRGAVGISHLQSSPPVRGGIPVGQWNAQVASVATVTPVLSSADSVCSSARTAGGRTD